jgi:adenylosuccinate synthase
MVDVLLGLQWGDEGKGKVVDFLAKDYDIIARFQGGPNAGHTLYINDQKVVLHTIPSGIFHERITNVIGNGVVLDPITFQTECEKIATYNIEVKKNLIISNKTHLIIPTHKLLDQASELAKGKEKIGSTLKGIGPTYMDKTGRNGLRVGDILTRNFEAKYNSLKDKHLSMLQGSEIEINIEEQEKQFFEAVEILKKFTILNVEYWLHDQIKQGKKVLAEGAQGSMLDIDFGTYPFVTSSSTTIAGVCSGLGVSADKIDQVIGITKAYCTRVGSGPFPTELNNEDGELLRKLGNEFGATTGRPRRCGWLDLVALKYAIMISGVTTLVMTKADVLNEHEWFQVATSYKISGVETTELPFDIQNQDIEPQYQEMRGWRKSLDHSRNLYDLPSELIKLADLIESYTQARVKYISTGVGREQIVKI